jgi:CrcB protein
VRGRSPDRRELAAIYAGGMLGALARVGISRAFPAASASWPWATFAINISGAFLLGYFATRLQERLPQSTYRRPLLGTGFCGAFTTFSTVQVEALGMLDDDRYGLALGYAAASIAAGLLAVRVATAVVRRVRMVA